MRSYHIKIKTSLKKTQNANIDNALSLFKTILRLYFIIILKLTIQN